MPENNHQLAALSVRQKLRLAVVIILTAVCVAFVYYYFEAAVHHSVNFVWDSWLNTADRRLLVVPATFGLGLLFFWLQHHFDPNSETHESKGLGQAPTPTLLNLLKVLAIGYFSLLAGASLGPEAILVPASLIVGAYIGTQLFKKNPMVANLLSMVGFVALFAAFFDSFAAGLVGLLLVTKQVKIKLNLGLIVIGAVASAVTIYTLGFLESTAYAKLPKADWHLGLPGLLTMLVLVVAGFVTTYGIGAAHQQFDKIRTWLVKQPWWCRWLIACSGLSALYLLGGTLVEFTGNESIVPMLNQAAKLGIIGLAWIIIVKVMAISWSKAMSYRGGLVFPSLFIAASLVAIAQQIEPATSFTLGLIAVLVGLIAANQKVKILF